MRQGLGYKYQHQARRLADFVFFMEKRKATTITTKLAVAWETGGGLGDIAIRSARILGVRLTDVRCFARRRPPGSCRP
jgi:hypothetical protein